MVLWQKGNINSRGRYRGELQIKKPAETVRPDQRDQGSWRSFCARERATRKDRGAERGTVKTIVRWIRRAHPYARKRGIILEGTS